MDKILLRRGALLLTLPLGMAFVQFYLGNSKAALMIASATLVMALNIALEALFLRRSIHNGGESFFKRYLSGKLVRLVIIIAIFFTIYVKIVAKSFVFIVLFFILYFLFQIIEIHLIHTYKTKN